MTPLLGARKARTVTTDKPEIDLPFVESLVRDIAERLAGGWTPILIHQFHALRRPDGATFRISVNARERRVTMAGDWPDYDGRAMTPRDYGIDGQTPMINVAVDRGAKTIASDIVNRFLPRFLAMHDACIAARDAKAEARASAEATVESLQSLLGGRRETVIPGCPRLSNIEGKSPSGTWRADLEILSEIHHATLSLRGPTSLIESVLRSLKAATPANENDNGAPEPSNDNNPS